MTAVALALLSIAALGFFVRAVIGPSLADRVVAVDGALGCVVAGIVVGAIHTGSDVALDAVLVVTLVGFVATTVAARYVERRGG
jgi:multicomponent Na+:H+ antiporter subunit F